MTVIDFPLATIISVSVETGFFDSTRWRSLADQLIAANYHVEEDWLLDVSMAANEQELADAIRDQIQREDSEFEVNVRLAAPGYLYIRYRNGEIKLRQLFELVGSFKDTGWGEGDPEGVYAVLRKLECGGLTEVEAERQLVRLIAGGVELANWCLNKIKSCCCAS